MSRGNDRVFWLWIRWSLKFSNQSASPLVSRSWSRTTPFFVATWITPPGAVIASGSCKPDEKRSQRQAWPALDRPTHARSRHRHRTSRLPRDPHRETRGRPAARVAATDSLPEQRCDRAPVRFASSPASCAVDRVEPGHRRACVAEGTGVWLAAHAMVQRRGFLGGRKSDGQRDALKAAAAGAIVATSSP